jgi:hypothetical protein
VIYILRQYSVSKSYSLKLSVTRLYGLNNIDRNKKKSVYSGITLVFKFQAAWTTSYHTQFRFIQTKYQGEFSLVEGFKLAFLREIIYSSLFSIEIILFKIICDKIIRT